MKCGAKNRSGGTCGHPAGYGTDHLGDGRCKFHGGATPRKHGLRSRSIYSVARIADKIKECELQDPLDLAPEVAAIRALASDFLERHDELVDALLRWNSEEFADAKGSKQKARPQRIPEIQDAAALLEAVSRVSDRIARIKSSQTVTLAQVTQWFSVFGSIVAKHVDVPTAAAIERDWRSVSGRPLGGE